jgi:hypothetical protein
MALKTIGTQADVYWLADATNGDKLSKDHAVIYMRNVANTNTGELHPKLGQVTRDSAEGLTPAECFEQRYTDRSSEGGDVIATCLIVIDKRYGQDHDYDDDIRTEGHRLFVEDLIPFDALCPGHNPDGFNSEALLGFKSEHFDILMSEVIKPALGYSPKRDIRIPWSPRDPGTPVSQGLMVKNTTNKVKEYGKAAFSGYTGVGKSHIGIAVAHELLEEVNSRISGGGLVLITTPIVDTAQDFENNINKYRYGSNRDLPVKLYRQDSCEDGFLKELRARANNGELIFLLLTVQDVRYDDGSDGIRSKYEDLISIGLDFWIRDEYHKEYNGVETAKIVKRIENNTTYLLDLSATLRKAIEQNNYEPAQIANYDYFWALENRHHMSEPKIPIMKIKLLGDISHRNLPADIQDMYDPTEGWNHKKMVETTDTGGLKQYAGFKGMFVRAYCLEDDIDANPFTINNHPDMDGDLSKRVGLWRFPHGADGTSAEDIYVPLAKQLRNEREFKNGYVHITSSWEIGDLLPYKVDGKELKTADEYVEWLLTQYNYVAIITQTKYCTGSNIPSLGHVVLCDNISSPDTLEQLAPGRTTRRYSGKDTVMLFVIAPGTTLRTTWYEVLAQAKRARPGTDIKDYMRQIQIGKYNGSWSDMSVEEMFGEFQSNLRDKIKIELSETTLRNIITGNVDDLGDIDIDPNKPEGKKKELTEDNESETKDKGDSNNDNLPPGAPKTNSKDKAKLWAQSINAVMVEVPAFAIPGKIFTIDEAVGHKMVRKLFGNAQIDTLLDGMDTIPALKNALQNKLTDIHDANQNLPAVEVYDSIFKNTERKKRIGLVFIKMDLSREIVAKVLS